MKPGRNRVANRVVPDPIGSGRTPPAFPESDAGGDFPANQTLDSRFFSKHNNTTTSPLLLPGLSQSSFLVEHRRRRRTTAASPFFRRTQNQSQTPRIRYQTTPYSTIYNLMATKSLNNQQKFKPEFAIKTRKYESKIR